MDPVSVGTPANEIHASNVALVPGVNAAMSGDSTKLLVPLKERQLPNLQAVLQVAPESVPSLLLTETSPALVPVPSLYE